MSGWDRPREGAARGARRASRWTYASLVDERTVAREVLYIFVSSIDSVDGVVDERRLLLGVNGGVSGGGGRGGPATGVAHLTRAR